MSTSGIVTPPTTIDLWGCDCCGTLGSAPMPYTHENRDGTSYDYCQECFDAGCDIGGCVVRENNQKAAVSAALTKATEATAPVNTQNAPTPPSMDDLPPEMQARLAELTGTAEPNPTDEKADDKPEEKKPEPTIVTSMIDPTGEETIIADVSTWDDDEPFIEVHKLAPVVQDGHRRNLDGSSTLGLSITQCGVEQTSRSHGWFKVTSDNQNERIERGEIPVCEKCFGSVTS